MWLQLQIMWWAVCWFSLKMKHDANKKIVFRLKTVRKIKRKIYIHKVIKEHYCLWVSTTFPLRPNTIFFYRNIKGFQNMAPSTTSRLCVREYVYWMMRYICVQTRYLPIRMIRHSSCIRLQWLYWIWHFYLYRNCPDWIRFFPFYFIRAFVCILGYNREPHQKKRKTTQNFPYTVHNVLVIRRVDQREKSTQTS